MKVVKDESELAEPKYHYGTGRRKSATAQVRVLPGNGKFLLNENETVMDNRIQRLLDLVGVSKTVLVSAHVHGGGQVGQIGAIIHGLARALILKNPEWRTVLKKGGYLTRDPREKEREKPGLHGARRAPQFSKR